MTGSDDCTVRIWDLQTRVCIRVLSHHSGVVTGVFFHPDMPLLFTLSEDNSVGVINSVTWKHENTLHYGLQRPWSINSKPGVNHVAIGFDDGLVVLKTGSDEVAAAMDPNGKIYHSVGNEMRMSHVKSLLPDTADGEVLRLTAKELNNVESVPVAIYTAGQYVSVVSDNDFTIYSALSWRPKTFGQNCSGFAFGPTANTYATIENSTTVKIYKDFKHKETLDVGCPADKLFGGPLLGVRIQGAILFLDWTTLSIVRRIEVNPTIVSWSDSGELVGLFQETAFFVLRYNGEEVQAALERGDEAGEDGLDCAFEPIEQVEDRARQAYWVGDCLCFLNAKDRLNYYIGGEVTTIGVTGRNAQLLGFLAKENRLICIDRESNIVSYQLHTSVIEYKTAICREDFESAATLLPQVPHSARDKVAQFLQSRGLLEMALEVSTDDDMRFELSVQLKKLDTALELCKKNPSTQRWKLIGDLALQFGMFDVAENAMVQSGDLNSLLLLHSSVGDTGAIRNLGQLALEGGKTNIAFTCFHLLQEFSVCVDLLMATGRIADAAFYARTHCHERLDDVVLRWKNQMAANARARDSIADPAGFPNLFPNVVVKKDHSSPARADSDDNDACPSPPPTPMTTFNTTSTRTPAGGAPVTFNTPGSAVNPMPPVPNSTPAPPVFGTPGSALNLMPPVPNNTPAPGFNEQTPSRGTPAHPRAPQPTPVTAVRPEHSGRTPLPNETPLIVKAAAAAALQATPSSQPDPTADHKLDYSPDANSASRHQDPAAVASPPKDSLDNMFDEDEPAVPAGATNTVAGADDEEEDFLGNGDDDWN